MCDKQKIRDELLAELSDHFKNMYLDFERDYSNWCLKDTYEHIDNIRKGKVEL
jgi:hypothetical protein